MSPELNQLWFIHGGYTVIDCVGDSVLTDTNPHLHCQVGSYDPSFRKVYAASSFGTAMHVIDMDTRLPTESLPIPKSYQQESGPVYCAVPAHKVYWVVQYYDPDSGSFPDTIIAIDTRRDTVVSRFVVPASPVCDDRTGNYVYFAGGHLIVVDPRTDSIVSEVRLPLGPNFCARNGRTNRIYLVGDQDSVIQVIYDSIIYAGVQDRPRIPTQALCLQTLLSRSTPFRSPSDAVLFDASGRRAAVLKAGTNDISHLAPGVYFIREGLGTGGEGLGKTQKVVVTR
jgi:hypothetical protein